MNRLAIIFLFLLPTVVLAQRGVDLRNWEEPFEFTHAEVYNHLHVMKLHNIDAVWLDASIDRKAWEEQATRIGVELLTGNKRFGVVWLDQCKPDRVIMPYDSSDCVTGLVNVSFEARDALIQLKKDYQPIQFSWAGEKLTVHKVSDRFELRDLNYEWRLMADGKSIESGWFSIDEDSLRAKVINLNLKTAVHEKQFHHLEVYARTKEEKGVLPAGHEVAKEQFELSVVKKRPLQVSTHSKMETSDKKDRIELSGAEFRYTIDRQTGYLSSIVVNDEELLTEPLRPVFFWPGDNMSQHEEWFQLQKEIRVSDVILETETPYLVKVTSVFNVGELDEALKIRYQIFSTGDIRYTQRIAVSDTMSAIPRLGVMMNFSTQVDSIAWFGRGPHTNFTGASSAAFHGIYEKGDHFDGVWTEQKWVDLSLESTNIFLAGEPEFACILPEGQQNSVGVFTKEKAQRMLLPPKEVAGQEVKLRLRIRPFDPEKEKAWKLSRFTVREMRPPLPKATESRKHEVVK